MIGFRLRTTRRAVSEKSTSIPGPSRLTSSSTLKVPICQLRRHTVHRSPYFGASGAANSSRLGRFSSFFGHLFPLRRPKRFFPRLPSVDRSVCSFRHTGVSGGGFLSPLLSSQTSLTRPSPQILPAMRNNRHCSCHALGIALTQARGSVLGAG